MKPAFQVAATFDTANRKKDKSVTLRFTTNLEISTGDYMVMDSAIQQSGWLLWSPSEIQPNEVPDVPADEALGRMTPSQETRWLLKRLYDQEPRDIEWPDFYRSKMARINEQIRALLT